MKILYKFLTVIMLLPPLAQNAQAQDDSWPHSLGLPNSRAAVAAHFLAFAQGYAASHGYRISDTSQRQLFRELLGRAAELASNRDAQIAAEEGLIRFVNAMITAGRSSPGSPLDPNSYGVLGERSFTDALRGLCPLWPVCD